MEYTIVRILYCVTGRLWYWKGCYFVGIYGKEAIPFLPEIVQVLLYSWLKHYTDHWQSAKISLDHWIPHHVAVKMCLKY